MSTSQIPTYTKSILCIIGLMMFGVAISRVAPVSAQVRVSPTPVSAVLPQAQPEAVIQEEVFASPTPSMTPTEDPTVMLEVKIDLETADTRELPDFEDGIRIDSIKTGTRYPVTGRYFEWLQFEYGSSSTGLAWVHQSLVDVTGEGPIPDIDPFVVPTATPQGGNIEETYAAVTLTPGAVETLAAQSRLIDMEAMVATEELLTGPLPTFTLPAEVAPRDAPASLEESDPNSFEETLVRAATGQIPPIVPILLLTGAGLLGMIVSLWRR